MPLRKTLKSRTAVFKALLTLTAFCLVQISPAAAMQSEELEQLKAMSLENLMQVTVFSASKKSEQLAAVSAAMDVITQEEIRRSGARTLPDLLRGVPGLHVANIDAHTWAISSRGFNGLFSNKLLVLLDGRTLYTPLYSGVYWDMQDTLLSDIERIEIIRGPGATIWGANAVNGVINIITCKADENPGGSITVGAGNLDKTSFSARYGHAGNQVSYRIYAKHLERDHFETKTGGEHPDAWDNRKAGFRLDWEGRDARKLSLQGDVYQGDAEQQMSLGGGTRFDADVELSGGSLQLLWEQDLTPDSSWNLQTYIDRSLRKDGFLDQSRTTFDLSFNHYLNGFTNQEIVWGGGYRYTSDSTSPGIASAMDPDERSTELINLFFQDDWTLIDETLHLIAGSKFEHNDYTGYEVQPTLRMVWTPTPKQSFWGAVSRAVRTPSRADSDLSATIYQYSSTYTVNTPFGPTDVPATVNMNVTGNPDFESEELIAYELGYRAQATDDFSIDLALFFNDFSKLRTQEGATPIPDLSNPADIQVNIPVSIENNMKGETYGFEMSANWQVTGNWRLVGSYSRLEIFLHHETPGGDPIGEDAEEESPQHQAALRSYLDLPHNFELDTSLFYYSSFHKTPEHYRCDIRLGWYPSTAWEASIKVENLFDDRHREFFNNLGLIAGEVPRNVFAEIKYHF